MFKLMMIIVKFVLKMIFRTIITLLESAMILFALGKAGELWDKLKFKFKEFIKKEVKEAIAE